MQEDSKEQEADTILIDSARRLVDIVIAGPLDSERAIGIRNRLRAHPLFDRTFSQVIDLRQADVSGLSAMDLKNFTAGDFSVLGRGRALISKGTGDDGLYSLLRAYLALAENQDEVAIFEDRATAIEWLNGRNNTR